MSNSVANTLIGLVKTEAEAQQVLSVAQASPEGEIILEALHEKVMSRVDSLLDGFIEVRLKEDPGISIDEMVDGVDGDIWHYERRKLGLFGFAVDVFRNLPKFDGPVRDEIRARSVADAPQTSPTTPTPDPVVTETPAALALAEEAAVPALETVLTQEHVPAAEQAAIVAVAETEVHQPGFLQSAEDLIHRAEDTLHIPHN